LLFKEKCKFDEATRQSSLVGSLAIGIASAFGCRRPARFYAITMIDDDDVNIMRSHEGILPQSGSHQEATEAVHLIIQGRRTELPVVQ